MKSKLEKKSSWLGKIAISFAILLTGCGGGSPPIQNSSQVPVQSPAIPILDATQTLLAAGRNGGTSIWGAGSGAAESPIAGVTCLINENYHIHAHISIYLNGIQQALPANIGLTGCAYELHTHDDSGIIHIETNVAKPFTLAQFFAVWGQPLTSTNVGGITGLALNVYLIENGKLSIFTGELSQLQLTEHRDIVLALGMPPITLPWYGWPAGL